MWLLSLWFTLASAGKFKTHSVGISGLACKEKPERWAWNTVKPYCTLSFTQVYSVIVHFFCIDFFPTILILPDPDTTVKCTALLQGVICGSAAREGWCRGFRGSEEQTAAQGSVVTRKHCEPENNVSLKRRRVKNGTVKYGKAFSTSYWASKHLHVLQRLWLF